MTESSAKLYDGLKHFGGYKASNFKIFHKKNNFTLETFLNCEKIVLTSQTGSSKPEREVITRVLKRRNGKIFPFGYQVNFPFGNFLPVREVSSPSGSFFPIGLVAETACTDKKLVKTQNLVKQTNELKILVF